MTEKRIAMIAVAFIATILSTAVAVCMVLEHPVPPEVIAILATLGGTLLGAPVLGAAVKNGVKRFNGGE
jgi:uncharacterized membrane protein